MSGNKRIKQAVGVVWFENKEPYSTRISRRNINQLAEYYRKREGFRYMKIYEIPNYVKGAYHQRGIKIGFITRNGLKLDYKGLFESPESIDFKIRHKL